MKIVVEAGATKSDWRILDAGTQRRVLLPGMNVSTISMESNLHVLESGLAAALSLPPEPAVDSSCPTCSGIPPRLSFQPEPAADLSFQPEPAADLSFRPEQSEAEKSRSLDGLYIYTAGIVTPQVREQFTERIRSLVDVPDIEIQDDLVAAARAVCGREPGIVAILGTGSNACQWDGSGVSFRVRSGGYIIGDEGGGAALGKQFLADYIKCLVPADVAEDFASSHDAGYEGIVSLVYKSASPAGALGSLAPWLLERYSHPYIKGLIDSNFQSFIDRSLKRYDTHLYPVGVVGGWGFACREIFSRLCSESGISLGAFESEPINGLVKYHI